MKTSVQACQVTNCKKVAEKTRLEKIYGIPKPFQITTNFCCDHGGIVDNQETKIDWIFK